MEAVGVGGDVAPLGDLVGDVQSSPASFRGGSPSSPLLLVGVFCGFSFTLADLGQDWVSSRSSGRVFSSPIAGSSQIGLI